MQQVSKPHLRQRKRGYRMEQAVTGASVGKQLDTGVTFVNANNMNDDYIMLMLYPDKY